MISVAICEHMLSPDESLLQSPSKLLHRTACQGLVQYHPGLTVLLKLYCTSAVYSMMQRGNQVLPRVIYIADLEKYVMRLTECTPSADGAQALARVGNYWRDLQPLTVLGQPEPASCSVH